MTLRNKQYFLVTLISFLIVSCSGEKTNNEEKTNGVPTKTYLKAQIDQSNDSLSASYKKMMKNPEMKLPDGLITDAIYSQLQYYHYYPKDVFSATCLDKVQQLFLQKKNYKMSLQYTDTLLLRFPDYKGRATLLLNAGGTGEVLQDTTLVRKYYTQLLHEYPTIDPETKEMLEFRLKNLKLSFDEMVELQMQNSVKK